jgi:hypothetical protein
MSQNLLKNLKKQFVLFSTKPFLTFAILFFASFFVGIQDAAAQKFTLSGTIKDARNGETMIGATVVDKNNPSLGASTNEYGFFSLTLPAGKTTIAVSNISYQTQEFVLDMSKNQQLNVSLSDAAVEINEVVIKAEKDNKNVSSTEMSVVKLDVKEIGKIPVIFGEKDILKTIQLLPGVKSAGEGGSGFYVRGGGLDQNLILLDEAPVYNASHLLGFFSVFNSDAIKDVLLFKGNMPAQYGGRLSSVLDVKMNDGNNQSFAATGGIGLIASRLTLEGPIQKDKSSFIISGRRTYADIVAQPFLPKEAKGSQLYFYDLNLKANYQVSKKDRVFLSGYFGRDLFGFGDLFGLEWGNTTATLRWNHIFTDKLFSNTSFVYSDYKYGFNLKFADIKFNVNSGIRDWNLKQTFQYYAGKQVFKFGFNSTHHTFLPSNVTSESTVNGPISTNIQNRFGWENAIFVNDEIDISPKFKANVGLRYASFSVLGGSTFYTFDADRRPIDSTTYNNGAIVKTYGGLEPRAALTYIIDEATSLKASYTRTQQFMQLLSNSNGGSPNDIWTPASEIVKPQNGDQYTLGIFKNFANNAFETSIETYYKTLDNQIDYRNGAQLSFNKYVEADLVFGRGWSYGVEFFVKKRTGKFTGWLGYTWSKTERQFDAINEGRVFPAKQDRTHDISVVLMYEITKKWNVAATWVYSTGNAVTYPRGRYLINGQLAALYSERNADRFPSYDRMDVGVNYIAKKAKHYESSWNFSVYNAYNKENPYSIDFTPDPANPFKNLATATYLFKIVPSVTWNFKFM